ncbi:glycosyltransferase family 2 protein [Marinilongibacter aquaticus]|uniref:glycosyltransferase family 2 protein n=1 Tax=Marinilongibacter aquaticus TaxID=2975157 RepID=UPI0021BD8256|nr:glycosyltransferase family 2 protein [Marinilongibacter aquaticus]UBM58130.1 glycosyltransferase family 2 protein [Marinilongibacter aquaticus]
MHRIMIENVTVLIPVYNDWEALSKLLEQIELECKGVLPNILVVNDCSSDPCQLNTETALKVNVLHLIRNVGHQRAIAIGMAYLAEHAPERAVLVMDADGEDKPADIPTLLNKMEQEPGKIVFAERMRRSEGLLFRFFYSIYRLVFRLLTGKVITFGNFSAVPAGQSRKLSFVSEIWNNYPGGVIRSKLPYTSVPLDRGKRLAGESKMNFVSLILHGMSAVAVFLDTVAVRLAIFAGMLIFFGISGIAVILFMKIVLQMATPGWASNLASAFFIIVLQGFFISIFMVFTVLSYRSNRHFIPSVDYKIFIDRID